MTGCVSHWHSEQQQICRMGKCVKVCSAKLAEYEWGVRDVDESHFERSVMRLRGKPIIPDTIYLPAAMKYDKIQNERHLQGNGVES